MVSLRMMSATPLQSREQVATRSLDRRGGCTRQHRSNTSSRLVRSKTGRDKKIANGHDKPRLEEILRLLKRSALINPIAKWFKTSSHQAGANVQLSLKAHAEVDTGAVYSDSVPIWIESSNAIWHRRLRTVVSFAG
jgi:hypothetical protein